MDEEALKKYQQAGEIAKKAKKQALHIVKPGAKVLDIVEEIEALVLKEADGLAFPLNFSRNDEAAHYTPDIACDRIIGDDDIIKFDVGVHIDGCIADTAITISTSESDLHMELIEAANAGLNAALDAIKPGITIGELSGKIENAIREKGHTPIKNLTGHSLEQYDLHAGFTIPNVKNDNKTKLEEGMAIAIEPFATNGEGSVYDAPDIYIYQFYMNKPTRLREGRRILSIAEKDFQKMPFAKRWLEKNIPRMKLSMALNELTKVKALYEYPVLKEKGKGLVAQAEHSIIVAEEPIVFT